MNERDRILARVRRAIGDDSRNSDSGIARSYRRTSSQSLGARVAEFAENVSHYHATVQLVSPSELAGAIVSSCVRRSIRSLVIPEDIPPGWLPDRVRIERDSRRVPITNEQLDAIDGVLTACALGIAQTGTIVLDGGAGQGRRVISLLPDYHLCVIRADQVVGLVPEALTILHQAHGEWPRPFTFVSGPSATSDIELNRIEGVHGPRTLDVLVVIGS